MRRTAFVLVFFSLMLLSSCAVMTVPGREVRTADSLFKEKRYNEAVTAYRKVLRDYPGSSSAAEARYRLALTLAFYDNPQKDYAQAQQEFEEFLKLYPVHKKAQEAQNWRQVLKTLDHLNKSIEELQQLDIKHEEKRKKR
jgi:outer membrane protein assembly factor BamD (BamD/ComL family)